MRDEKFLSRMRSMLRSVSEIFDLCPIGLILTDLAGEIIYVNERAVQTLRCPSERLLGRRIGEIIPGLDETLLKTIRETRQIEPIVTRPAPDLEEIPLLRLSPQVLEKEGKAQALLFYLESVPIEHTFREREKLLLLNSIARSIARTLDPEELARVVYRELARFMEIDAFYIAAYLPEQSELDFLFQMDEGVVEPRRREPLSGTLSERVILTGKPLLISDLESEGERLTFKVWGTGKLPRSYLGVPMVLEGEVTGIISAQSYRPNAYTKEHLELLSVIASQVALALRNSFIHEEITREARRLATVNEIGQRISATLELGALFHEVVESIQERFGYFGVCLYLVEGDHAVLKAVAGEYARLVKGEYRQPLSEGIIGWVITSGESALVPDVSEDPRYIPGPVPPGVVRSELCVPIVIQGEVRGALDVQSTETHAFTTDDLQTLEAIAAQVAIALHNAELYTHLSIQQELLRNISDSLIDATVVITPDLKVEAANKAALELTKLPPEKALGLDCYRFFFGEDQPCSRDAQDLCPVKEVLDTGRAVQRKVQIGERTYKVYATPIKAPDGTIRRVVYRRRDITSEEEFQRKLRALQRLGQDLIRATDEEGVIKAILDAAENLLEYKAIAYLALDKETNSLVLKARRGCPMPEEPLILPLDGEKGITVTVARTGQYVYVPDVTKDPRYVCGYPGLNTRSELDVPVKIRGEVVGVINVEDEAVDAFGENDVRLVSALADHMAMALENIRLFRAERRQRELTEALAEAVIAVGSVLDLNEVLDRILEKAAEVVDGDAFNIALLKDGTLTFIRWRGYDKFGVEDKITHLTMLVSEYPNLAQMIKTGEPVLVPDTYANPKWIRMKGWEWLRSYIGVPIRFGDEILGVLNVDGAHPNQFGLSDVRRLEIFAAAAAVAINNARMAQALAESEERYRILAEDNLAGVYLIQDNRIIYVNPALARTFGYQVDELLGREATLLVHPDDRALVMENLRKRIEGEVPAIRYRFKGLHKNGSTIYCEVLGSRIDYKGKPAVLGTLLDITEQVLREEQTRRRAKELEALNTLSQSLLGALDPEEIQEASCEFLKKITSADIVAFHLFREGGGDALIYAGASKRRVPISQEMISLLEKISEGVNLYPEFSLAPVPSMVKDRLKPSLGVIVPVKVSGVKRGFIGLGFKEKASWTAEELSLLETISRYISLALDKAFLHREVLRAWQEWKASFDAITDGLCLIDKDFTILRVNRALSERVGMTPEELTGRKCYEVVHRTDGPPKWCPCLKVMGTGEPESVEAEEPDLGKVFVFSVYPVKGDSGEVRAFVNVIRDVTREKEMQERLFQAEKLASLGQLVSGVAHELNNPLTAVVGYAQLVTRDPALPDRLKADLLRIQEQAQRAAYIVQNMLDFARKRPPRRELVDINELLRRTLDLRAYEMRVNNITVSTDLAPHLPMTMADPQQIQQVFLNIIVNAEQAMSEAHGGGNLHITTRLTPEKFIRIEFSDDGPGIPKEHLSKIFDPFFTTKEKGTGMGLAIAYSFVAEHQGRIWVQNNTPAPGVTFFVELPVVESAEGPSWAEKLLESLKEEKPPRKASILVIDDERPIADLLRTILCDEGYEVTALTSSEQAYRLLQRQEFDLIVVDVKMPGMDGKALYEKIRAEKPELASRFVFITGAVMDADVQAFLAASGCPYLSKPFNIERVKEVVRDAIEALRSHQELPEQR